MPQNDKSALATQIEDELRDYFTGVVNISENNDFSESKLKRRISLFENKIYPTGKFDSQGNYKFWFDIITPRINSELKNIDFDTKDVTAYSDRKIDDLANVVTNLKLKEWMRENGQAEDINDDIEEGSGWGNVLWKKVKGSYERNDLKNTFIINQTAENIDQTPVIERHPLSQSEFRAASASWKNVDQALTECKSDTYSATADSVAKTTTTPYYEIFERNGEVCLEDLKEERGEEPSEGDENRYVLAKVIAAGIKGAAGGSSIEIKYILFAEELGRKKMSDIYKEFHRGRYKGRWFREGLIELLFDCQVRANQIGNQIAQGLEWASKTFFSSEDKLLVQNVLTDMKNGDIIKAKGMMQVAVRMEGFDQLIGDWNRVLTLADSIANSSEVVQGENLPAGTPFQLGALLNQNSNKLYDFIREKLAIPLSEIFQEWIIPELVKNLQAQDVMRLTGDSEMLMRLYQLIVDDWYLQNLIAIGPHTPDIADALKQAKLEELKKRPQLLMTGLQKAFEDYAPNVAVIITGENSTLPQDLATLATFTQLETDPIRRSALIELAMRKKGIDVASLPKTPPAPAPDPNAPQNPTQKPQPKKSGAVAAAPQTMNTAA